MAGSLPRTPLRELIPMAGAAGFDALSLWPNAWRHARQRDGLGPADMAELLGEHGMQAPIVEAVDDWRPAGSTGFPSTGRTEAIEVALAVGAPTLATAHAVGGDLDLDRDADAFGWLCDDAAEHGLRVALEFVPFTAVPDIGTALALLRRADRPNAGLVVDLWHLARSGRPATDLKAIAPELVLAVQLADGPATPSDDLLDEATYHRRAPGAGDLPLAEGIATLQALGVEAPVGPEVYVADWADRPAEWAEQLYAATTNVLALAGVQ